MTNIVREQSNLASNVTVIKRQTVRADHTPTIELKRVAAYCRVSTDLEAQQSSIDLQMSSYKRIIEEHPGWVLAGIYADDGETGTSVENRPEFQRMYADAMAGCFDILLVKSVSRFARNTKDSLEYTRELKAHGVSVYFEKEGLDTSGFTSEFLLTIFAAFAQEESRSISENVKRGIRNRYKLGKPMWRPTYGFRKGYVIYEPEAEVVREIFQLYNQDISAEEIAQILNEKKAPLYPGSKKWVKGMVTRLVSNEKYIGDVLMQKTYCADFMTHKSVSNSDSKIERYYKEGNHDPIVSKEVFYKAGRLKGMRSLQNGASMYPYYGFLKCPFCGKPMLKIPIAGAVDGNAWVCGGEGPHQRLSERTSCPTYLLKDSLLKEAMKKAIRSLDACGDENIAFAQAIIMAQDDLKKKEKITFRAMDKLVESITFEDWDTIVVNWKMGWTGKYPIQFYSVTDALIPKMETKNGHYYINGIMVRARSLTLQGFENRQAAALKTRVIDPGVGDLPVPKVIPESKQ